MSVLNKESVFSKTLFIATFNRIPKRPKKTPP